MSRFIGLNHAFIVLAACGAALTTFKPATAQEASATPAARSQRAEVLQFLKSHVLEKTVATKPIVYPLAGAERTYSDEVSFSNLVETKDGFCFDVTVVSKGPALGNQKRGSDTKALDFGGVSVYRYELGERKSTGGLVGFLRPLTSTVKGNTLSGVVLGVHMELRDGQLHWTETQVLYRDVVGPTGGYRSVAVDSKCRLFVADGRLNYEYEWVAIDEFDSKTLKRNPLTDAGKKGLKFLSSEIDP